MPVLLDAITKKKLVLAKRLYQRALVQAAGSHSTVNRLLAVVMFDLCVETVLKASVRALNPRANLSEGFNGYTQQANAALAEHGLGSIPDLGNVKAIHDVRNKAQHDAAYPNESEVSDCRTYTRDFVAKYLDLVWGVTPERLTLVDQIEFDEARQFLSKAEEALDEDNPKEAAQFAHAGLRSVLGRLRGPLVGRNLFPARALLTDRSPLTDRRIDSLGRNAFQAFDLTRDAVVYLSLGMSPTEYVTCRALAGEVAFTVDGQVHFSNTKADITLPEAEYVVSYCIDAVIEIEARVGDLETPLGVKHWYI